MAIIFLICTWMWSVDCSVCWNIFWCAACCISVLMLSYDNTFTKSCAVVFNWTKKILILCQHINWICMFFYFNFFFLQWIHINAMIFHFRWFVWFFFLRLIFEMVICVIFKHLILLHDDTILMPNEMQKRIVLFCLFNDQWNATCTCLLWKRLV